MEKRIEQRRPWAAATPAGRARAPRKKPREPMAQRMSTTTMTTTSTRTKVRRGECPETNH
jgi:hypothetical protein